MGLTEVDLTIKNPVNPKKQIQGKFLVDSGAFYTVVPAAFIKRIDIKPQLSREFTLADGKTIKRSIGGAIVKFGQEEVYSPVVLGKKGDNPLMGALTLEAFGLALDPFQRKLYRAKMML